MPISQPGSEARSSLGYLTPAEFGAGWRKEHLLQELADSVIEAQLREIDEMKVLIKDLEDKRWAAHRSSTTLSECSLREPNRQPGQEKDKQAL